MLGAIGARLADCDAVVVAENVAGRRARPASRAARGRAARRSRAPGGARRRRDGPDHCVRGTAGHACRQRHGHRHGGGSLSWRVADRRPRHLDAARVVVLSGQPFSDRRARAARARRGARTIASSISTPASDCSRSRSPRAAHDVLAVEGDRSSGADLAANAGPWRERLRVVHAPVEEAVHQAPDPAPDVVVVDPPRTGVSPNAVHGLIALGRAAGRLRLVRSADARARRRDGSSRRAIS